MLQYCQSQRQVYSRTMSATAVTVQRFLKIDGFCWFCSHLGLLKDGMHPNVFIPLGSIFDYIPYVEYIK